MYMHSPLYIFFTFPRYFPDPVRQPISECDEVIKDVPRGMKYARGKLIVKKYL